MPVPIDIVLPCYNPGNTWVQELTAFHQFIDNRYLIHFIVVNDGSIGEKVSEQTDHLKKAGISLRFITYSENMGKGHALRKGVAVSEAEYIIYTDIDFPFTNQSALDVINELVKGSCDVAAGYRNQDYYVKSMTTFRKLLSKSFRFFTRKILGMKVSDTQCGLKGFNKKGKEIFLSTGINRYLFDFEFIFILSRHKSIILNTVPVTLKDKVIFSKMKFKVLVQEILNLFYILLFKRN